MESTELGHVQRRARRAYEYGRVRRAAVGVLPLVMALAIASSVGRERAMSLEVGTLAVVLGMGMLWYGRDPQRAVFPGLVAGIVPLSLSLCANSVHTCAAGVCSSWCVPACAVGGVVAALSIASAAKQRRASGVFWLSASMLALMTGGMGCACVGRTGLIALVLGFGAGLVPSLLQRVRWHDAA